MRAKYSLLEMLFADRWQWVRKRSKMFWCKDSRPGYTWVKFTDEEMRENAKRLGLSDWCPKFEGIMIEDWRERLGEMK